MSENQESKAVLKSTGTVGGSQIINILISLVKTKIVAVILGASGVGIVGILTTASDMIKNIAGLGLPFSGVRDISIADSNQDNTSLSKTVKIFNRWVLISAFFGALITIVFSLPLSQFLFNNNTYAIGFVFLSTSIFFLTLSSGFTSVMQGKRSISLMAKASVVSNIISSFFSVILYILLKEKGIISSLVVGSLVSFLVTYYFYRELDIPKYGKISFKESWLSARGMIRIGIFTILVSAFDQLMSLLLRGFISDKVGVEGVGLFTAANTIATMYLSIVLGAMAGDYYPKLASIHDDNKKLNLAVNTQLYIVLLLGSPIIIGMVGFADIAVKVLYSSKFMGSVAILKWQVMGDFFKIIAWACGYVFLAKGLGKLYVFFSISYTLIYLALIYLSWDFYGFFSVGLSFFISQFLAMLFTYLYSYLRFGINISIKNIKVIFIMFVFLAAAFSSHEYLTGFFRLTLSVIALLFSIIYSVYNLSLIMDMKILLNRIIKRK
ncbi:PST family polysaccharide transporter [Flavobacterium sp. HSC-32F16]|uniref:oligosaccharide flippase family protein n=1 Tax=Flavobacterium sp. HSC-32F16 TaxID=2910964 RepID=UPI0020A24A48|nr:oligosaccharide flippase family protein [Flavobacterium sp. HSC-32F16]MCP2029204.1 PST family polysaccharide transporter [Flavobacterium sp. HSC-32F16]